MIRLYCAITVAVLVLVAMIAWIALTPQSAMPPAPSYLPEVQQP